MAIDRVAGEATGKSLDARLCHVGTFRSGRVSSLRQYVDTALLQPVKTA
jgi:ketosteroid isomerase-like protein